MTAPLPSATTASFVLDQPIVPAGVVPTATVTIADVIASLAEGPAWSRFEGGQVYITLETTDTIMNNNAPQQTVSLPVLPPGVYNVLLEECFRGPGSEFDGPENDCYTIQSWQLQVAGDAHPVPAVDIAACLTIVTAILIGAVRTRCSE